MLWWPNSQYVSPRHVQYINRSQLLITDLQPAEDDTRRRVCSAMLMNPSAPASRLPSVSANLSSHTFSCHPSVHPSIPLIVHLFFSIFARLLSLSVISIHLSWLPARHLASQPRRRDSAPTMDFVYTHVIPSSTPDLVCVYILCVTVWEDRKRETVCVKECAYVLMYP